MTARIVICVFGAVACSAAGFSLLRAGGSNAPARQLALPSQSMSQSAAQTAVSRREYLARLVAETAARTAAETAAAAGPTPRPVALTAEDTRLASRGTP